MPVASAIFYIAVGAMAGSLDFSFSPEIGGTSKMQSMHSDFGPAVEVAIISPQSNQGGRKLREYFHLPVAMNKTDKPCDAEGDVAKCQQAVHGLNIKRKPDFRKKGLAELKPKICKLIAMRLVHQ
jgi:hypothetical protein